MAVSQRLYKRFDYTRKAFHKSGVSYYYSTGSVLLFGETVYCSNNSFGLIQGMLVSLSNTLSVSVLVRNLDRRFIGRYSKAFTESSGHTNESGLYIGFEYKLNHKATLSAYIDRYKSPWLTFLSNSPSNGSDNLFQFRYKQSKQLKWDIRYKCERKEISITSNRSEKTLTTIATSKLRFNLEFKSSKTLSFRSRFETTSFNNGEVTWGSLLYQDVSLKLWQNKIKLRFRLATSNISNFANRIYTYENDVAYSFAMPFYSDNKLRTYVLLEFKALPKIDFWLKVGNDYKSELKGSGNELDSVYSPNKYDVKVQMRIKL
jgi:hypothetical protein